MHKDKLEETICSLIARQFYFHKGIAVQDIYKLLYQASYGAEHLMRDANCVTETIFREANGLRLPKVTSIRLPVIEPISSTICRVNLIPYLARGYYIDMLVNDFIAGATNCMKGADSLFQLFSIFMDVNKSKGWFQQKELGAFFKLVNEKNLPPVHHSYSYKDILADNIFKKPHYLVISSGWRTTSILKSLGFC